MLPRDVVRLVLLARSLTIWAAVNQAYYCAAPSGVIDPIRCSPEMALFCLTEQSIHSPKLKRVLQGLQYTHDAHNEYWAITTKKPDPITQELAARRINGLPVLSICITCFLLQVKFAGDHSCNQTLKYDPRHHGRESPWRRHCYPQNAFERDVVRRKIHTSIFLCF